MTDINFNYRSPPPAEPITKKKPELKRENECRRIFEKIFNKKFKKVRPKWLRNDATNCNLELDGYCADIITPIGKGLAFEHDGAQHRQYTPHFQKSENDFVYQTKKDELKFWKCKQQGIILIRIPDTVIFDNLESYIKDKLDVFGVRY
ncbi:MAG TPA: hypothetical protein VLE02_01775 [Nitrosarchaeum sp.]|nr:hypothetical protein [Nitrosarchaeum sp.]